MTDEARSREFDHKCELCGTPVRTVGNTTKSYESAYDKLKTENEELSNKYNITQRQYFSASETLDVLRTRIQRLESALKFYADEGNYCWTDRSDISDDGGKLARKALEGEK